MLQVLHLWLPSSQTRVEYHLLSLPWPILTMLLGYSAYLLLDVLWFFRWPLRATEMRLDVRVSNLKGL